MDFYDDAGANALWKSFGTARDVDRAYAMDPRFEAGDVVERRYLIQHRFFSYLGSLFERFVAGKLPDVMIHTSHFEVLHQLASMIGPTTNTEPLIHGEIIQLHLMDSVEYRVRTNAVFRGHVRSLALSQPAACFLDQFVNYR